MIMEKNIYQAPELREVGLDMENFICTSMKNVDMYIEVDEYDNMDQDLYLY